MSQRMYKKLAKNIKQISRKPTKTTKSTPIFYINVWLNIFVHKLALMGAGGESRKSKTKARGNAPLAFFNRNINLVLFQTEPAPA